VRPVTLYYDVNVSGARRICEVASRQGITRIVFTSSVAVYGASKDRSEQNNAPLPNNHYGRSKWEAEKVYRQWHASDNGRHLLIIRPTVVFGENNRGNVYNLLRQIRSMPSLMVGMGANIKSLAYVENLAAFIENQLEHWSGSLLYNYVDQPDVSMRRLVFLVRQTIGGGKSPVIHLPYPVGAAIGRLYDFLSIVGGKEYPISAIRMKKLITDTRFPALRLRSAGFKPPFSLREGIEKTIRHEFLQQSDDRVLFESE
jgi:nucleoside-diphosphate-sugar epimerase